MSGDVLSPCEKYFNVLPVLPVLPGEDVVAGEMETDTGQATEMPALDCSEGGDYENTAVEVLETVSGALDLPRTPGWRRAVSRSQEPGSSNGGQSVGHKCSVCLKTFKHKGTTSISRLISMESS